MMNVGGTEPKDDRAIVLLNRDTRIVQLDLIDHDMPA
jgi:hypothetical protein